MFSRKERAAKEPRMMQVGVFHSSFCSAGRFVDGRVQRCLSFCVPLYAPADHVHANEVSDWLTKLGAALVTQAIANEAAGRPDPRVS